MERPIIFLVAAERSVLQALDTDLERRFGNDCRILSAQHSDRALADLTVLAEQREPVALLIADHSLREVTGVAFLEQAHPLHPSAKRILLVERDYTAANPIVPAMMLGQIDYHLVKPWFPEQSLFPAVDEFLADWAGSREPGFKMFRIVGPAGSARAHEVRDLLTRLTMPYVFHAENSEAGRRLLRQIDQDGSRLPVVVRHDGRVLVAPSDVELIEAIGGGTRLSTDLYDLAIVGANSAGQAAAFLAKYATSVTLLVRGDSLTGMSEYLANELRRTSNVTVRLGVEVVDGEGDGRLEA